MKPTIVTLTGPSCAGKSTLERLLREQHGFMPVISTTTRPPRAGEVHGQHYYFMPERVHYEQLRDAGAFIESVEFNGNYYSVSAAEIERAAAAGKPICIVVEPEGRAQIIAHCKRHDWNLTRVFVDAPSELILSRYLRRFYDEMNGEFLSGGEEKVIQRYASRLNVLATQELHWWEGDCGDIHVPIFDESTQDDVVQTILNHLKK